VLENNSWRRFMACMGKTSTLAATRPHEPLRQYVTRWLLEEKNYNQALYLVLGFLNPSTISCVLTDQFHKAAIAIAMESLAAAASSFLSPAIHMNCGMKFERFRPQFIGVLVLTHRGCGVQHFLSINQTLTRLRSEDFWKGK
jgi:hypothetical protein